MLSKPGKDDLDPSNYRPISLLNTNVKLLGKILATHVNDFLHTLIHGDQVGFIPHCQAGDNVRRVVHLVHIMKQRAIPGLLVSLDIQKAFDTVSWDYLQYVPQRWNFGPCLRSWVASLYHSPSTQVSYSGYFSSAFQCLQPDETTHHICKELKRLKKKITDLELHGQSLSEYYRQKKIP